MDYCQVQRIFVNPHIPFHILLLNDGNLVCNNFFMLINENSIPLKSLQNSKNNYTLFADDYRDDSEIEVFTDEGEFTEEFLEFYNSIKR